MDQKTREKAVITDDVYAAAFAGQGDACAKMGAPFTALIMEVLGEEFAAGKHVARLARERQQEPVAAALALRFAGALHHLVLSGDAPGFQALYPPNPMPPLARLRVEIAETIAKHEDFVRAFLKRIVQTNELGRSACLLGGFLTIAQATGLPLRTLEIGASGGMNSLWDQFRYTLRGEHETAHWGETNTGADLSIEWFGPFPALETAVEIAHREAADISPVDLRNPEELRRVQAYIWPDQPERHTRFQAGVACLSTSSLTVEKARASSWLHKKLKTRVPGQTTVIFHSIMWQYMSGQEQGEVQDLLHTAGSEARNDAPLAWLRMEPPSAPSLPELKLTLWPDGATRHLATCHPHGSSLKWHAENLDK